MSETVPTCIVIFMKYALTRLYELNIMIVNSIKHGYQCIISILRRQDRFFRKLILTEWYLVTQALKVMSTDPYINR